MKLIGEILAVVVYFGSAIGAIIYGGMTGQVPYISMGSAVLLIGIMGIIDGAVWKFKADGSISGGKVKWKVMGFLTISSTWAIIVCVVILIAGIVVAALTT